MEYRQSGNNIPQELNLKVIQEKEECIVFGREGHFSQAYVTH